MPLVLADRVNETTTTTSTGTITLAGAVSGYQSFAVIGNGNTTYYTIVHQTANEWEVGIGTYTSSGTTLARNTVLASSNSGSLVNFSAGTKFVFCDYPAGRAVYLDTATNVTIPGLTLSGGTANGVLYLNGSKVATSGSALTFDGTDLATTGGVRLNNGQYYYGKNAAGSAVRLLGINAGNVNYVGAIDSGPTELNYGAASTVTTHAWNISGTGAMALNSTGLGIGTTSPGVKLDVSGAGAGGLSLFRIVNTDTTASSPALMLWSTADDGTQRNRAGIGSGADGANNGYLYFNTRLSGSLGEKMRLGSSGNLGLGVTPSAWGSDYRAVELTAGAISSTTAGNTFMQVSNAAHYSGTQWIYKYTSIAPALYQQTLGQHRFLTAPSGTAGNAISFTQAMTLDASGNLGIGTASPGQKLHISGGTSVSLRISATGNAASGLQMGFAGSSVDTYLSNTEAGNLIFGTNNTERARITSGGNLLLGTTTSVSRLTIAENAYDAALTLISANEPTRYGAQIKTSVDGGQTNLAFLINQNSSGYTERARITAAGNLGIGTTSPAYRLQVQKTATATPAFMIGGGFFGGPRLQVYGLDDNGAAWMGMGTDMSAGIYELSIYYPNASGNGRISFGTYNGTTYTERMSLSQAGNLNVVGALSKGSGSFRIPHPLKEETHDLVHSFIEGPQADLIYSGKVQLEDGVATVNIDAASGMTEGTFVVLCRDIRCFTNNETDWDNVRGKVIGNLLTIECQNPDSDAVISWMVIGERQDKHMYDTDWTDADGKVIVEPLKPVIKKSYN